VCILLAYAVLGMFMDAIGMLLLNRFRLSYPAGDGAQCGEFVLAADSAFGMSGPMCGDWFGILVVEECRVCLINAAHWL